MDSLASNDDAEIARLFGIKQPFSAPLFLSYPLNQSRRLSADEAAQLCERGAAIQPTTRDAWEIAPMSINGVPHATVSKMTLRGGRHAEATWLFPLAPGEGQLRLSAPLGSGRTLCQDECRQLRSIGGEFKAANPAWTVKPHARNAQGVEIYRYRRAQMVLVGSITLAQPTTAPFAPHASTPSIRQSCPELTARSRAPLNLIF